MTPVNLGQGVLAVLFGPPGSGKGTQAGFIGDTFDLAHISTGDLLRAEVARGSALGREVEPIMAEGQLVPDDLVVRVIESRLGENGGGGVLLDGFPRTVAQAEALDRMLHRTGRAVDILLVLDVPEEELHSRILGRAAEEGRVDDTPETVQTRLEVYRSETEPVLDYYQGSGVNVQHVDGVGTIDGVQDRIRRAFRSLNAGTVAS